MSIDFSHPTLATLYATLYDYIRDNINAIGKMNFDGGANIPTGFIRWNGTDSKLEKWNGSAWVDLDDVFDMTVTGLDGLSASLANINRLPNIVGTHVNNASGYPLISTTEFDVKTITESTWESVGPTGSGATNTWTALDDLDSDDNFIRVRIDIFGQNYHDTEDTECSLTLYARKNGTSATAGNTTIAQIYGYTDSNGNFRQRLRQEATIPISSAGVFDLQWEHDYFETTGIDIYLIGHGQNA